MNSVWDSTRWPGGLAAALSGHNSDSTNPTPQAVPSLLPGSGYQVLGIYGSENRAKLICLPEVHLFLLDPKPIHSFWSWSIETPKVDTWLQLIPFTQFSGFKFVFFMKAN